VYVDKHGGVGADIDDVVSLEPPSICLSVGPVHMPPLNTPGTLLPNIDGFRV
jgi:hypothetical protein